MTSVDLQKLVGKFSKKENYEFNGCLMYKNIEVAYIENSILKKVVDKKLLPIIMIDERPGSFEAWLQTRVIDTHRTNSRQVRRRLSVRSEVPKEIVIKARAVSITDNYWLKWNDEKITFNEIREKLSDGLNKVALYGNSENIEFDISNITPELTNIGSFEKCWKNINNEWYMIKKANIKENFAEVVTSKIGQYLGFNIVNYDAIDDGRLVKCKDFTNNGNVDFEPMYNFVKDYWEVDNSIEIIKELGYINEFLDITFMDALCYNIDRHTFNFGVIRKDGEIIGLAPNFDNNLALSGVLKEKGLESTWYSTAFNKGNYLPLLKAYKYKVPDINLDKIKAIIKETLEGFPTLKQEDGFDEVVLKIIKNNYNEIITGLNEI